jgi:hypothetical protein
LLPNLCSLQSSHHVTTLRSEANGSFNGWFLVCFAGRVIPAGGARGGRLAQAAVLVLVQVELAAAARGVHHALPLSV